jgi:6-phosphofructokinase 2
LRSRHDAAAFAADLVARGVAARVVVAMGPEGSVLAEPGTRLFCPAPKVAVKSKVGAGDSYVAGHVLALARGGSSADALALGVAAASAAVMTEATELCHAHDVEALLPQCVVAPLPE